MQGHSPTQEGPVKGDLGQSRVDQIECRFAANYARAQYHFVQFFTEHLVDATRTFGGDLQQVVILAVMGQRHIAASIAPGQPTQQPPSRSANTTRIADVTGLPRETVRRKLLRLKACGWVRQTGNGEWELIGPPEDPAARRDLQGIDQRGIARLARLHAALEKLI